MSAILTLVGWLYIYAFIYRPLRGEATGKGPAVSRWSVEREGDRLWVRDDINGEVVASVALDRNPPAAVTLDRELAQRAFMAPGLLEALGDMFAIAAANLRREQNGC